MRRSALVLALTLSGCAQAFTIDDPPGIPLSQTFTALAHGDHSTEMYGPYGLASDAAGNAWAMYVNSNKLARIKPDGTLDLFEVGSNHTQLAIDKQDHLWLLDVDGKLEELDTSGHTLATLAVGDRPAAFAISPENQLWVTYPDRTTATTYAMDGAVVGTTTFDEPPGSFVFDGQGTAWTVTHQTSASRHLVALNGVGKLRGKQPLDYSTYGMTGSPLGGVWLADDQGTVHRVVADGSETGKTPVGGVIYGMGCTVDGSVWMTRAGAQSNNNQLVGLAPDLTPLGSVPVGPNPQALAIAGATGPAWVLNTLDGTVTHLVLPLPRVATPGPSGSFRILGPTDGPDGLVTSVGHPLQLRLEGNGAGAAWRVPSEEQAIATVDATGLLTPHAPGAVHVSALVGGVEDSATVAVADGTGVTAIELPAGVSAGAPSSGATLATTQASWDALLALFFKPNPPPSPAPTITIDFTQHSVLAVATTTGPSQGKPVVTRVKPSIQVVYPAWGGVGYSEPAVIFVNQLHAFEIPAVPAGTPIEVDGKTVGAIDFLAKP